ncbi:hypothetical protein ES703_78097 [subsurface metagenome]
MMLLGINSRFDDFINVKHNQIYPTYFFTSRKDFLKGS